MSCHSENVAVMKHVLAFQGDSTDEIEAKGSMLSERAVSLVTLGDLHTQLVHKRRQLTEVKQSLQAQVAALQEALTKEVGSQRVLFVGSHSALSSKLQGNGSQRWRRDK
jgi:hypothetical protein